jgi:lysine/ornithine N-monooxygenase
MRLSGDYVIPDLAFRALKSAGAAFFEPNLDHLSLKAILVLASGKFSAEIFDQVLAATATRRRHMSEMRRTW